MFLPILRNAPTDANKETFAAFFFKYPNFYHEINTNTFAGDTLLWHSKFKFIGITADGSGPAYTGNATAIINEAGIFNKSHTDSGNTDPIEDVIMLARRTFSEKPVKIDDELTIKWQITIK